MAIRIERRRRKRSPRPSGRALRRGERAFQALFDSAPVGLALLDAQGRLGSPNAALSALLGLSSRELRGKTLGSILQPQDAAAVCAAFEELRAGRRGRALLDARLAAAGGRVIYARLRLTALRRHGRPLEAVLVLEDVSAQREAEQRTRLLGFIVESTSDSIAMLSPDGTILACNPAGETLWGYRRSEYVGQRFELFLKPEEKDQLVGMFHRLVAGERLEPFEHHVRRKDGAYVRVLATVSPIVDAGGAVIGISVIHHDISARHHREEFRRALLEAQLEASPDGIVIVDSDAHMIMHNRRFAEIWSLPPEVLASGDDERALRESAPKVVEPEKWLARIREVNADPDSASFDEFTMRDGRAFERVSMPVRGEGGARYGRIWFFKDVTERKQRAAELDFRRALLEAQIESSPNAILIVDGNGRILKRNRRFEELWRIPRDVLASGSDDRAIESVLANLRDPDAFVARVRYLYDHPEEKSFEELALRDGRTLERFSAPVRGQGGTFYGRVWYFRDITERRRAERQLAEKTEELARSNAELRMYADAASHDLAAPLNKIAVFAELLLKRAGGKLDEPERGMLERIRKTASRASTLVRDMLTLAKLGKEVDTTTEVDWRSVVADVLSDLEVVIAAAGATVDVGELPPLRAPEAFMRRLLFNLIGNAVKFRAPDRPLRVEVRGTVRDGGVELSVRDNGIGFDPRQAERLFKPFVRLHPVSAYEGSGLGLAICRRIAERLGGRISAQSEPGRGSTFTLVLPASPKC